MKELRKKIDYFMLSKGGYTLLIATVATVVYFAVLQWSNNYVEEAEKLLIEIDNNGNLSVNYDYEDKDNIYVLWETDGGNIEPLNSGNVFVEQFQKDTKGYYGYGMVVEDVFWNPEDADGNSYSTATVRAVLYEKNSENPYLMDDYVTELTITLNYKDGKITKVKDRLFGNPIRDNSDTDWNQIYCVEEKADGSETYRYRTGAKIDEEVLILCWESKENILYQMDYAKGFVPESVCVSGDATNFMKAVTTVTCQQKAGEIIKAYLIDEKTYNKNEQTVEENEKQYLAEFTIES